MKLIIDIPNSTYNTLESDDVVEVLINEDIGQWIPVSEKLPSDCNEDWVLAQIQEDNGYLWVPCVAEYRKDTDDWYSDANNIGWLKNHKGFFKVIGWMPLPQPYEPQESEKYCDRNICVLNEYNGIGCDECEVTKSRESQEREE